MRISDWSSDVCSSDLAYVDGGRVRDPSPRSPHRPVDLVGAASSGDLVKAFDARYRVRCNRRRCRRIGRVDRGGAVRSRAHDRHRRSSRPRSEEHTSELQSLMRISSAVFCLTKKKTNTYYKAIIVYTTVNHYA